MDMKRILQAFDNASTKPVEGADDMRRFVSAVRALNSPITEQSAATPQILNKIKQAGLPNLEPVNPPPLPQGEVEAGEKITTKPDGTTVYMGGFGTYTYDKTGKPIKYSSPSFSGLTQTTDLITGNITVRYMAGPLDVSQTYDKTGKPTGDKQAQYNLGTQTVGMKQQAGGPMQQTVTPNAGMTQQPAGESVVTENTLRTYIDIVERTLAERIPIGPGVSPEQSQAALDAKQRMSQELSQQASTGKVAPSTPAGKIDYTKEGPKTKSSQDVELEYGVPINKKGEFMNPQKLPNWDAHSDDEQFEILQAYKAWLRDFTRRWPNAKQRPDGTWDQGLAPMAPSMPKFENAGFKDYLQMIEEGRMSEVDIDLQTLANRGDEEDLIAALEGEMGPNVADVLQNMMDDLKDELAAKGMNDVINDEDKMIEVLWNKIVDEFSGDEDDEDLPFEPDTDASDRDEFGNIIKHRARHLARRGMRQAMKAKKDGLGAEDRVKFRGTDHDIGEERYVFAVDGNPLVFNFPSDEDNPDPDSPSFEEILAKVQRDGAVERFGVTPAEQRAMAEKIADERQRYLDQRREGVERMAPHQEAGAEQMQELVRIRELAGCKQMDEGVAGPKKCWPGHRKVGTKPGTGKNKGKRVNDCEKI